MCLGLGGDRVKKDVEGQLGRIATAEEKRREAGFGEAFPFFKSRKEKGLPFRNQLLDFEGGTLARSAAPQRAALLRRAAMGGLNPNDPAVLATMGDFEANLARGFDDRAAGVLREDELARQSGARALAGFSGASDPLRALIALMESRLA